MLTNERLQLYPLFAGLCDAELDQLAPCLVKRIFAKDVYLYHPGNPGLNIYLIESGLVRVFFVNAQGEEFMLYLHGPHSVVGLPVLKEKQMRMVGAAAHAYTVAWVISREDLWRLMERFPKLLFNAYLDAIENLRMLGIQTQALLFLSLDGRLASLFLYLTRNNPNQEMNEIELPLNQAEVASWVGARRGPVNRALSKMQTRGLIRVSEKKIVILDRRGLMQMAEGPMRDQV